MSSRVNNTLKDISKFSPPHIFIPASYSPISMKYFLSMAKSPPAIVGDLIGLTKSSFLSNVPKSVSSYQSRMNIDKKEKLSSHDSNLCNGRSVKSLSLVSSCKNIYINKMLSLLGYMIEPLRETKGLTFR